MEVIGFMMAIVVFILSVSSIFTQFVFSQIRNSQRVEGKLIVLSLHGSNEANYECGGRS